MRSGLRWLIGAVIAGAAVELARRGFWSDGREQWRSGGRDFGRAEAEPDFPVDEASEESFPASDPPSYMSGGRVGGPRH